MNKEKEQNNKTFFVASFQKALHQNIFWIIFKIDYIFSISASGKIFFFIPAYYIMHRKQRSFKLCFGVGVLLRFLNDGFVRDGSLGEVPFMNGIECLEYLLQPSR